MHIQSDRRALGGEGGGHGRPAGVLSPAGEGEGKRRMEHPTVWLVSHEALWCL